MKKFFKALALVLALTLVVGTIPASAAEYEFSLKKEKKIIYLGGASGEKEVDGETIKCGTKSRYKVSKLVNGFDPATMDIQLESSDKSIVKTSNAKDKVYAKAIGTADVKIYVYDKETEKQISPDLTLKVQVKKNATAPIAFVLTDAEGNAVDLTASKAGVNVPYIVTLPRKDAAGNFVDTDYRTLTASDESVQIEATNKYNTQYKVTFTKAGSFTITAATYQSKIWNKLQNVVTVPVTAGYDAVAVEQSSLDTVKVTFDTPVAGLEKANFNAYYKINEVVIPYSDVADITYDSTDKNVAYVKFLSDFIANTEFFVQYDKKDVGSFKAANPTVDSVKTVLIPTQKIDASTETDLQFKLLNEQGIDITASVLNNGGVISFEILNDDFKNYVTSSKVYITNAGDSITVKGTYTYWDSESNQKTVTGEGQIVAVTPAVWTIGSVTGMITVDDKALVTDKYELNGDAKAATWTMDFPGVGLQIAVPYSKNGKTVYEGFAKDTDPALYESYSAKVADETIALITGQAGDFLYLKANKPGSTTVLIYGNNTGKDPVVIGAVPVTVKEGRKIGSWTVTASKTALNLDYDDDKVVYEFTIKDQDGQDYANALGKDTITVKDETSGSIYIDKAIAAAKATSAKNGAKIEIFKSDLSGKGVHNIQFTIGNETKTLRLSAEYDGPAVRYLLKLSDKELKTGIKLDTDNSKSISIGLEGLSQKGTAASASGVAISFVGEQPKATPADKASLKVGQFYYTITKDGKLMDKKPATLTDDNVLTAFAAVASASDDATKLEKGTYVVTAYEIKQSGTSVVPSPVGAPQTFVVTDDQVGVEVKKNDKAEKLTAATLDATTVGAAFDITFDGKDAQNTAGLSVEFVGVNPNEDGSTAYVTGVNVYINARAGKWKIYVPIDTLVKKG